MRLIRVAGALIPFVAAGMLHAQDCTFNPDAVRPPAELWHRLSLNAEAVAPTAATPPAKRRSSGPPKTRAYVAKNFIDEEIFAKMVRDGVSWTVPSTDEEFLRRVTLDLTGQIPDAATVKAFVADTTPDKRDRMIDQLLRSEEFVERWTLWFGDLIRNLQFTMNASPGTDGRNAMYNFIRDSIRNNKGYDQMVREVLTGVGGSSTVGPANYWVREIQGNGPTQDTYDNMSADSAQQFLGLPLVCLSCHNGVGHVEAVNSSLARRTRYDFWKNAAFFAQTSSRIQAGGSNQEYFISENAGGEYRLNTTSGNKTPRVASESMPSPVAPAFFLSGEGPRSGESRRVAYARMLTANPQFSRAAVNYLWKAMFGIGIVEPADSFDLLRQDPATLPPGATLQPTHPYLLNKLADAFSSNGYSLRELLRLITQSNAYQLSSRYAPGNWNETFVPYYARHYPRRILAESVLDAIARSTSMPFTIGISGLGQLNHAVAIPDPTDPPIRSAMGALLYAFGRGDRDSEERSADGSIVQALLLLNDQQVTSRVKNSGTTTVAKLLKSTNDPGTIVDELYLGALSRKPTAAERQKAISYLTSGDLAKKTEDLQFSLINRIEFLFN